jgi:high-affinity Fe2+/Pb2+ permease
MCLAKCLFPKPVHGRHSRQFRALRLAISLGLVCSLLVAVFIYLISLRGN